MERRVLLAIFLAFLVLYVWQAVFVKPVPKPLPGTKAGNAAATTTAAGDARSGAQQPGEGASSAVTRQPTPGGPVAAPLVADTSERDVRVETQYVVAVFTNRGARLKSWRLKRYLDQQRQPQELVESQIGSQPLPFTLRMTNEAMTATLNDALYTVAGAPVGTATSPSPIDVRFEYRDDAGVHAVKEFHLDSASYVITFRATITEGDRPLTPAIVWGPAVGDTGEQSRYVKKAEGIVFENGKVVRAAPKDIAQQPVHDGDFGYVGNYGWSIIILTFIINAILFPLRHKSVVSMRKMQEIQPEVKAIQERYSKLKATDPAKQKMNQEMMALYKERGVNPASGCVPMLLTFPFIFAFYALLSTAIELRGAPWFGWIHDLSAHDP